MFSIFIYTYVFLALTHILIQIVLGHVEYRRQIKLYKITDLEHAYSVAIGKVSVIVPVYDEDPEVLRRCIQSILNQNHPDLEVIVIDDGSPNPIDHEAMYDELTEPRLRVIELESNVGKRHAMKAGFDVADGEYIVTVDSDTIVHDRNAVLNLLWPLFVEGENLAAVTGEVRVENRHENLLTRLIGLRYWMAFNQERAPQSLFGVLTCCSGPFSVYRTDVIRQVEFDFVSQEFLGEMCTYGDDRHLTNLVLERGYEVKYNHFATADTFVPTTMKRYLTQQLRWSKSFYRELLWTRRFMGERHPYMAYDLILMTILPFMLITALIATIIQAAVVDPMILVRYAAIVAAIGLIRTGYGWYRTRDAGFLLFVAYGFIHVSLLIPVRLRAIATLKSTGWGTRGSNHKPLQGSEDTL